MNTPSKIIAFTIIAKNYYPQASVLAESYTKLHPDHEFFIFYIDNQVVESSKYTSLPIKIIGNQKLLNELSFKYNITEYSTSVKPQIFSWLIKKYSPKIIYYIDPDICFYKKLDNLTNALKDHDCILIPHRTNPTNDDKMPDEKTFMGCGYYNLGFVGFSINSKTKNFFSWWEEKLKLFAYSDISNLMFTDQKWMDFAPCFLNTYIVRKRGYNVAYWNLHEYVDKVKTSQIVFFHFSGFIPEKDILSKHQNRFNLKNISHYKKFFKDYTKRLSKFKTDEDLIHYEYPYDNFDNGVKINQQIRDIYRYVSSHEKNIFTDLFMSTKKDSFFQYLNQVVVISEEISILNYFILLNYSNKEISKEFPLHQPYNSNDISSYLSWCFNYGKSIYNIPIFFLNQQKLLTTKIIPKKFGSNYNLSSFDLIISIEKSKYKRNNSDYIIDVYRTLLRRYPDEKGFKKNLNDLNSNLSSRDILLLRTLKSQEFLLTNKQSLISIFPLYFTYLIFLSIIYKLIGKYFVKKNKIIINEPKAVLKNLKEVKELNGINVSGYLDTENGVGESARGLVTAMDTVKININLNNIEQQWLRRENDAFTNRFTKINNYKTNLVCVNADQVPTIFNDQIKPSYFINKYNIGYWYWESNIFPDTYNQSFEPLNEIWTATSYIQKAIDIKSPKPVVCIPPSFTKPDSSKIPDFDYSKYDIKLNNKDKIFFNSFDSVSFWERKNPIGLIKAFKQMSINNKNAKLIIKTTKLSTSEIYNDFVKEIGKNKQIYLIDQYISPLEMQSLMKSCYCYVTLHRAEGLGIPLINAHMMGKAVISTNFSGNTDFENNSNTFLVRHTPYILSKSIGPYPAGTLWAEPDIDHAAQLMDKVCNMTKSELKSITEKGKRDVTDYFSPIRIGNLIADRLKVINKQLE